ncbi:hypothetical protein PR048_024968 [Dryococelus australis]|uniref:Uncharacterized protein n=1 Tax=Dryococelus australis TaxID=614101 RepID=A0ABQ9GQ08_9NEOP|nr:hypothetical protein PR048_024968 [Dryococelus australis]
MGRCSHDPHSDATTGWDGTEPAHWLSPPLPGELAETLGVVMLREVSAVVCVCAKKVAASGMRADFLAKLQEEAYKDTTRNDKMTVPACVNVQDVWIYICRKKFNYDSPSRYSLLEVLERAFSVELRTGFNPRLGHRILQVGIVPDDTIGRGFSRGSPVSPAPSSRRRSIFTSIILIGSEDLDVKSRPDLFTLEPASSARAMAPVRREVLPGVQRASNTPISAGVRIEVDYDDVSFEQSDEPHDVLPSFLSALEAEKRGSDMDNSATSIKRTIATKLNTPNWRAVFSPLYVCL